ncbi:putative GTP cyclohydrolase II [Candidatus Zinderia insecticola CARI]|uniref:Putative GTP cyclohydrolase II n=1 Tax=Zinderia insecticola (strain CARI) TaxID=871271 RepID=E0TIZ4_ZINIC|nr:putative GTP cyclohydrolase II [Candidatus Zinderia insecticola CARI]
MNFKYFKNKIKVIITCKIPIFYNIFRIFIFVDNFNKKEHIVITLGKIKNKKIILIRIHSECITGESFYSQKCDCGFQLKFSLKKILIEKKGIIFYLRQEGRNIGIKNKIKVYYLQDLCYDTYDSNIKFGFLPDSRYYYILFFMILFFNLKYIKIITNNIEKIKYLNKINLKIIKRIPIINKNFINKKYLNIKFLKFKHKIINFLNIFNKIKWKL